MPKKLKGKSLFSPAFFSIPAIGVLSHWGGHASMYRALTPKLLNKSVNVEWCQISGKGDCVFKCFHALLFTQSILHLWIRIITLQNQEGLGTCSFISQGRKLSSRELKWLFKVVLTLANPEQHNIGPLAPLLVLFNYYYQGSFTQEWSVFYFQCQMKSQKVWINLRCNN